MLPSPGKVPRGLSHKGPAGAGDAGPSPGRNDPLEEQMAPHSSVLAGKLLWTEEPGELQSTGWQGVQ